MERDLPKFEVLSTTKTVICDHVCFKNQLKECVTILAATFYPQGALLNDDISSIPSTSLQLGNL